MDEITQFGLIAGGITLVALIAAIIHSLAVPLPYWIKKRRADREQRILDLEEANLSAEADPPLVLLLPPRGFSITVTETVGAASAQTLRPLPPPADL